MKAAMKLVFVTAVACFITCYVVADDNASATLRRRTNKKRELQASIVTKLELINAKSDAKIIDLVNGQIINVDTIFGSSNPELSVNAVVSGPVGSIRFGYNNTERFKSENAAPYALCGDTAQRDFIACTVLGYGTHTVSATPITNGIIGPSKKVTFTISRTVNVPLPAPVKVPTPVVTPILTGLRLMYTGVDPSIPVFNLQFGKTNVIDLQKLNLPESSFNIEALVGPTVKSVKYSNGRTETSKPLAYCGNDGLDFFTCGDLELGTTVTVSVTAYSEQFGNGNVLGSRSTTIQIIRTLPPVAPSPPTKAPVLAPPVQGCPIPKLVGDWERSGKPYPISVAEAQGTVIGNDFVITSGFKNGYNSATPETYAINMFNPNADWRRMEDMPFPLGLTHLGVAVKGMKAFFCGGYVGGSLGIHNGSCFQYDHSIFPGRGQWSNFSSIPDGGRSGGGMIYDSTLDALVYSAGSQRPKRGSKGAIDFQTTWMYSLKNPAAGWVRKADIPFHGNHMNFVTAHDEAGKEHHYFFGGQNGDNEENGNTNEMYEYNAKTNIWTKRASVPYPIGHAAASARSIGCGFIIAGGRTNNGLTDAVTYYDIPTNTWTKIGELTNEIHTNVCVIINGLLRCETGWATGTFSWNRRISL